MTIAERLEALTHNLELLSLETEKPDKQIAQLSTLVTEVAGGTPRLLRLRRCPNTGLTATIIDSKLE
jgi:hypothetical protein